VTGEANLFLLSLLAYLPPSLSWFSSKSSEKRDKEAALKEAMATARLWEMRCQAVEQSRQEYRENSRQLVAENDRLQTSINQVSLPSQIAWEPQP